MSKKPKKDIKGVPSILQFVSSSHRPATHEKEKEEPCGNISARISRLVHLFDGHADDVQLPINLKLHLDSVKKELRINGVGKVLFSTTFVWVLPNRLVMSIQPPDMTEPRNFMQDGCVKLCIDTTLHAQFESLQELCEFKHCTLLHLPINSQREMQKLAMDRIVSIIKTAARIVRMCDGNFRICLCDRYGGQTASLLCALFVMEFERCTQLQACAYVTALYNIRATHYTRPVRMLPEGDKLKKAFDKLGTYIAQNSVASTRVNSAAELLRQLPAELIKVVGDTAVVQEKKQYKRNYYCDDRRFDSDGNELTWSDWRKKRTQDSNYDDDY